MVWLFKVNDSYVWRLNCNARLFELKWSGGMLDSSKTKKTLNPSPRLLIHYANMNTHQGYFSNPLTWYYYEPNMTLSISKKNNLHIF